MSDKSLENLRNKIGNYSSAKIGHEILDNLSFKSLNFISNSSIFSSIDSVESTLEANSSLTSLRSFIEFTECFLKRVLTVSIF